MDWARLLEMHLQLQVAIKGRIHGAFPLEGSKNIMRNPRRVSNKPEDGTQHDLKGWKLGLPGRKTRAEVFGMIPVCRQEKVISTNHFLSVSHAAIRCFSFGCSMKFPRSSKYVKNFPTDLFASRADLPTPQIHMAASSPCGSYQTKSAKAPSNDGINFKPVKAGRYKF